MTIVGQVEIDPYCQRVLAKHWPEVPRHDNAWTCVDWWRSQRRSTVDVVAGGFPCQSVSQAGRKMAQDDPRWLWPAMFDVIRSLHPTWVIAENVPGLRSRGLGVVLGDLRGAGYTARAGEISACAMGAPHPRSRLFVLAHTTGLGRCPWGHVGGSARPAIGQLEYRAAVERGGWWAAGPGVERSLDGFSTWLDGSGRLDQPHKLVLACANDSRSTVTETMRMLRDTGETQDDQGPVEGYRGVPATAVLFVYLRQLAQLCVTRDVDVASPEVFARTPRQQRLLQLLARAAVQAWSAYRRSDAGSTGWNWEDGLDRTAYGVPSGTDRRRALGNGVVPQVAEHIGRLVLGT